MTAPYTAAELAAILARIDAIRKRLIADDVRHLAEIDVPRLVAELTRAREALRKYGSHTDTCLGGECGRALEPGEGEGRASCDCGFSAALASRPLVTAEGAALGEEPADGDTER